MDETGAGIANNACGERTGAGFGAPPLKSSGLIHSPHRCGPKTYSNIMLPSVWTGVRLMLQLQFCFTAYNASKLSILFLVGAKKVPMTVLLVDTHKSF